MSFRMFLGLQLLMFLILGIVGSQLNGVEVLQKGVVLNFAVFYLTSMLIGFMVKNAPLVNSLMIGAIFYMISYFLSGSPGLPLVDLIVDAITAVAFAVAGTYVGVYSRPQPTGDEDVAN